MTNGTCTDPSCDKPILARGLCVTHYHRWNRATKDQRPAVGTCEGCGATLRALKRYCGPDCRPRCSIDGCEKPRHGDLYCSAHHTRWRRYGDPLAPKVRHPNVGECSVGWCGQPMRKAGLCASHYAMQWRYGEIHEWNYRWGDGGYVSTHKWLRRVLGNPDAFPCVDCGRQAQEWSYSNDDPDELIDESHNGCAYSRNPDSYSPRCVPCHRAFDRASRAEVMP